MTAARPRPVCLRRPRRPAAPLCLVAALLALCACSTAADMVLTGGRIYTLDERAPVVEAVAIRNGFVVATGSDADIEAFVGASTQVLSLGGRTAVPGFADSHLHLMGLGESLSNVDLVGTTSFDEVVARVSERAAQLPAGSWVRGRGWDQNDWRDTAFPRHERLSGAVPRHPVVLERIDGHAVLANAEAMRLAGVGPDTKAPAGGSILRDGNGSPTGVFIDNACALIEHAAPAADVEARREAVRRAQALLHSRGVTSVHDAGVDEATLDLYVAMAKTGDFSLRNYVMVQPDGFRRDTQGNVEMQRVRWLTPMVNLDGRGRIDKRAIKLSADGALGSRGAALIEAYDDDPGNHGLNLVSQRDITAFAAEALRRGMQLCVHAIGDRANRAVLDAFEQALRQVEPRRRGMASYASGDRDLQTAYGRKWGVHDEIFGRHGTNGNSNELLGPVPQEHRFRIEHAQVLQRAEIDRFSELGVIPSMQAQHQTSDMPWADERIGKRTVGAYAWRSLLDTGVIIAGGSDAPVERPDPLVDFHAAVTRSDASGQPLGGWHPEQRMTREEALKHLTLWPAIASHNELRMGRIAPAMVADIAILSGDPMQVPEAALLDLRVDVTIFDGQVVYQRSGAP